MRVPVVLQLGLAGERSEGVFYEVASRSNS